MNTGRYFIFIPLLLSCIVAQSLVLKAEQRISGLEIKAQATSFFEKKSIEAEVLVSDKRIFFECSKKLKFYPRVGNDWRSIIVECLEKPWKVILRTSAKGPLVSNNDETYEEILPNQLAVVLVKNISIGQVINTSHIEISKILKNSALGSFSNIEEVLGRKVTRNLSRGSILKPRHLELTYDVEKNDTVIITIGNSKLNVTTQGLALDHGQIGDAIRVRNTKSSKVFRAIISDKKKVMPLANM